jgi:SPP1 family predicted phage head-tail adaptor
MACALQYFFQNAKHTIEIQSNVTTQDADGFISSEWQTIHTLRAAIKPLSNTKSGLENVSGGQNKSIATHIILIRYQEDLKSTKLAGACRVAYDGRLMNVLYLNNLAIDMKNEGKFYQQLMCEENSGGVESNG